MNEFPLSIRLAHENDAAAIAEIYNEAIRTTTATFDTEPKSVEDRRRWLAQHDERHPVWVAEVDGNVVGWASISAWSDRPAYKDTGETSFYVIETHRGRGIGRKLKAHVIDEARRLGYHTLLARTAQESGASIHINESFGFQHIGTMKEVGLKFGKRLDVHVMQLMLGEAETANASSEKSVTVRQQSSSGTPWEASVGYSRSVRVGDHVFVSGTTATDRNGRAMFPDDAYRQAKFILEKIAAALADVGASLSDVTRTRMFVTDISRWDEIGKAHGEVFADIRPAATMVEVSRLIDPQHLVEIEVDAVVNRVSVE